MGGSASSQLDESKCTYIRGKTEAVISNFSPHFRRQFAVALFHQIRSEVEQHRDPQARFLKSQPPSEQEKVLYEAEILLYAEDLKKWKERYVVIKQDYSLQCFDSKEAYQKGTSPKTKILPTGGKVLTSEEEYNALSDKQFPDPIASSEKESAQPFIVVPSQFPVYLWHPYMRHSFFCFQDSESQKCFGTILEDCIRHQNHDFLKQSTLDAQAFSEALQFFRQEKGHYGSWEMVTGNQTQILSNLVMEELLPSLQTDLLPKMKGKRNDRKRAWFGTVEETYTLVLGQVSEGFQSLQEECKALAKQLEATIRSDMDQIVTSKEFVAGKIKATVMEPAEKCFVESIQPFLASVLEELMGPVSSGFSELRQLLEKEIDAISQSFQTGNDSAKLTESLAQLGNLPASSVKMEPCYLQVNLLREQLQDLKSRFKFYHIDLVVQRAQNDMQELMENAVYTFEHLLSHASKGDPQKMSTAIEKVKLRVLKQYDYDSSTIRKKIFQEALVLITMPTLQRTLASTCKPELQTFEQYIFADYTNVIQVENVYEEILFGKLLDETIKVIQEAASLKKHNLFEDSMHLASESESSLTDLKTPSSSAQSSPERTQEPVVELISDNGGGTNEVFVESKDALSDISNAGSLPARASISVDEEQVTCKPPEPVLKAEPPAEKESLTEVENVIIADIADRQESTLVTVQPEDIVPLDQSSPEKSCSERDSHLERQLQEGVAQDQAVSNVNEIRNLLTVTIEVPADASQNMQEIISEGRIVQIEEHLEDKPDIKENVEASKECEAVIEQMQHLDLMSEKQCDTDLEAESEKSVTAVAEHVLAQLDEAMVTGELDPQDENRKDITQSGISAETEDTHLMVVVEAESCIAQVDKAVGSGDVGGREESGKDVAVGLTLDSIEADSGRHPSGLKTNAEEFVDHSQATSKVEGIETGPEHAGDHDELPHQACEDTNVIDATASSEATSVGDESPTVEQVLARVEPPTNAIKVDVKPEPVADDPNNSKQMCAEIPVRPDIPNCTEHMTLESTASACIGQAGEASAEHMAQDSTCTGQAGEASVEHVTQDSTCIGQVGEASVEHVTQDSTCIGQAGQASVEHVTQDSTCIGQAGQASVEHVTQDSTCIGQAGEASVEHVMQECAVSSCIQQVHESSVPE
ncbi:protein Niban 1 [Ambystoma mexicanum]|uniref:protein Niban 1 n=1 Tax=Ambystoma mexicanum TaxID=8296 RepID=UPI0037E770D5